MTDGADPYLPDDGHIVLMNFSPVEGHERDGQRPGIVLFSKAFNKPDLMLCVPMTTKGRGFAWEVAIKSYQGEKNSVAITTQINCMDWRARGAKYLAKVTQAELFHIRHNVKLFVGHTPAGYKPTAK